MRLNLQEFSGAGYDKGRPLLIRVAWSAIFEPLLRKVWFPSRVRIAVLRAFGSNIGDGVLIRHDVRIHWPWKLTVGNNSWIGVDAWLLNLEPIRIGSNVCVSQGAFLCTGSHDARSRSFEFDNAPITIGDEVWIAARATVLRGVTVGSRSIVGATALVTKDVPPDSTVLAPRAVQHNRKNQA